MADPTIVSGLFGQLSLPTNQSISANALTNERSARPEAWRPGIIETAANGTAPLLALTNTMPSEKVTDTLFHWWQENFPEQRSAIVAGQIYSTNSSDTLSNVVTGGTAAAGDTVYVKFASAALARNFAVGNTVQFVDIVDATNDVTGRVVSVHDHAADYNVGVYLTTDDTRSYRDPKRTIANATYLQVIGSAHAQGGGRPVAKSYMPQYFTNYTQIFKNSLKITRTAAETKNRIGDMYAKAKADAFRNHAVDIERAFLFGTKRMDVDSTTGEPLTQTDGLINQIRAYAPSNIVGFDYDTTSTYAGQYWKNMGWKWLREQIEVASRIKGPANTNDRLIYCGRKALMAIQECIDEKSNVRIQITPNQLEFGINVQTLVTSFGNWHLQTHPLFDLAPWTNTMLAIVPKNFKYMYITDTKFLSQTNATEYNTPDGYDLREEHFLTECGLEVHVPEQMMLLTGVGVDNEEALP